MLNEILLAFIQAATEYLPISSSGHLALFSNLFSETDLWFFTVLHIASLLAILIFTRKEIYKLISFEPKYRKMWLYLIIATIPAALVGYLLKDLIEESFSSYLFLGIAFIFTGCILLLTKLTKECSRLNYKNSLVIGLFQVLALFPGVSRSGMTISFGLFAGLNKKEAVKFSFLLFIPLVLGAMVLEAGELYFNSGLVVGFITAFVFSLLFLNLLYVMVQKNKFWLFGFYCILVGLISLGLWLF